LPQFYRLDLTYSVVLIFTVEGRIQGWSWSQYK